MTRPLPLAAALLGLSLAVPAGAADLLAPEPGAWWEITSVMTVRGARIAPEVQQRPQTSTSRECLPKRIPDRAPPDTDDCKLSDYRRSGSKVSFKMACEGGVTGETQLVWTADTYSGTALMRGQGMENRIAIKGKRLGGDCDANAEAREREREKPRGSATPGQDGEEPADPEDAPPDEPGDAR